MNRSTVHLAVALCLGLAAALAHAQVTPVGLWKTIDDETHTERSLIRLTESNGVITGKVEKVLDPAKVDAVCDKCTDERKDKPMLGMTVVKGVKRLPGDEPVWGGGEILDPNKGKTYKLKLTPVDGGAKLDVRGFIGFSLLGRTQTWIRVE